MTDEKRAQRNRLKTWMKKQGIDRQEFADKLDYKKEYIDQVLSGKNAISKMIEMKLSKCYPRLNVDWIMKGQGSMERYAQEENRLLVSESDYEYERSTSLEYDMNGVLYFFNSRIQAIDLEVSRLLKEKAELEVQRRGVEEMIEKLRKGE